MFPKARLPHTPPSLYKRPALSQGKPRRSWGDTLRFGGVPAFGVDMPTPRRRQLSEKSGAPPEPGISGSNDLCKLLSCLCEALYKLAKCFLRRFLNRARAWGRTKRSSAFSLAVWWSWHARHALRSRLSVHHCPQAQESGRLSGGRGSRACWLRTARELLDHGASRRGENERGCWRDGCEDWASSCGRGLAYSKTSSDGGPGCW